LSGRTLHRYRVRAREARYERDYEAIVEMEQYHYASEEEVLAVWHCERCGHYATANTRPQCPRGHGAMRLQDLRDATPASRLLVLALLDREPYEPHFVAYVHIDPPIPFLSRRRPDGEMERQIREKVSPEERFRHPFRPREDVTFQEWWAEQGRAREEARRCSRRFLAEDEVARAHGGRL